MTHPSAQSFTSASKQTSPHSFKFAIGEQGEVQGYGSIFGNIDSYGERVLPGAFSRSIAQFKLTNTVPLMLWQHRPTEPIGQWTAISEDQIGLRLVGKFNLNTTRGRDAYEHVRAGDINGLSIGYNEIRAKANGDVRELLELELLETSIVSLPANPRARVTGVKCESFVDVERVLREGGLPRAAAVKIAAGGWPLLSGEKANPAIERFARRLEQATSELRQLKV